MAVVEVDVDVAVAVTVVLIVVVVTNATAGANTNDDNGETGANKLDIFECGRRFYWVSGFSYTAGNN